MSEHKNPENPRISEASLYLMGRLFGTFIAGASAAVREWEQYEDADANDDPPEGGQNEDQATIDRLNQTWGV